MLIRFSCVHCQGSLEVESTAVGAQVACPHCGKPITIPKQGIGPGATIGGFHIERKLAAGGMGEIYIARQLSMDRTVALKILPQHLGMQQEMSDRFLHELRLLARLEHPNIVTAHDAGEDAGILYFAMAYIQGESLAARIKREGYLAEQPALALTRKLASALAYAWNEHQLLHRDIKPSNILLDKTGEPKLVDFGLAKSVSAQAVLTLSSTMMGTPNYMSPEQIEDSAKVDVRADMYSLGATLYNMVTGQIPFAGSSVMDVLKNQLTEPLSEPREFNPHLSDGVVGLLEILLAKDRTRRHESWEAVIEDIDRVQAGQAPLQPSPAAGHSTLIRMRDQAALAELKKQRPIPRSAGQGLKGRKGTRVEGQGVEGEPGVSRKTLWLAVAGAAAVVLIGAGVWWAGHGSGSPSVPGASLAGTATVQQAKAQAVTGTSGSAVVPPSLKSYGGQEPGALPAYRPSYDHALGLASGASSPADDATARARQAYMSALEYQSAHLDDMKGSIARFEAVKKDAAETEYQAKAEEQIKRIEALKKQAVDKAWLPLKAEADKLAAAGKPQEAVDKLEQFNGVYAAEMASSREALASKLKTRLAESAKVKEAEAEKERQAQAEKEAAAKKEEAQKQFADLCRDMAAKLLSGDIASAAALVQEAKKNSALVEQAGDLAEVEQLIQKLAGLPDMLAASFEKDKGREVAIEFKNGQSKTLQIVGVDVSPVGTDQRPSREGRTVKARRALPQGFMEQDFAVADVSANEQMKRLAGNPAQAAAILRGLAAYEARNAALAVKEFSSVEGRVGMALVEGVSAEVDQASAEGRERAARQALQALAQLAGLLDASHRDALQSTGGPDAPVRDVGPSQRDSRPRAASAASPAVSNLVEAVRDLTLTSNQVVRVHAAVAEFRDRHGKTAVAKENGPLLEALAAVISVPSGVMMVDLGGGVKLELVWIRPGEFQMGSPAGETGRADTEGPQHKVQLTNGFWMGKYEVTQAQWERVMPNNPSHFKGTDMPVEQVNWNNCQEFIGKLNALIQNRKSKIHNCTFRLPTEAEWEYACRAGTKTPFHTGDSDGALDRAGWYKANGGGTTHPVGQKEKNAWGLYDMHGNVLEWCQDRFGRYDGAMATDPTGPSSGAGRVLRGGSLGNNHGDCRSAFRTGDGPAGASSSRGFRVVGVR